MIKICGRAIVALCLATGLTVLVPSMASAHTPSGGATCETGVFAGGRSYESSDTNTLAVSLRGFQSKEAEFEHDGYLQVDIPRDGLVHHYTWSVSTTHRGHPEYNASGEGDVICGLRPLPVTQYREASSLNCDTHLLVQTKEERSHVWLYEYTDEVFFPGPWTAWRMVFGYPHTFPTTDQQCPPVTHPKIARFQIRSIKACNPYQSYVWIQDPKHLATRNVERTSMNRWVVTATTDHGYVFSDRRGGGTKFRKVVYTRTHRHNCGGSGS